LKLAETCLNAGCTPGIVHHSTKELAPGRPMTLQDLTGAGVAEFSRQWILVNSRTPYDPARPGRHDLIVSYGGSAGHGGLLAVSVDEGELKKDFSGRKWDVAVRTLQEAEAADLDGKQQAKADRKAETLWRHAERLAEAVRKLTKTPGELV